MPATRRRPRPPARAAPRRRRAGCRTSRCRARSAAAGSRSGPRAPGVAACTTGRDSGSRPPSTRLGRLDHRGQRREARLVGGEHRHIVAEVVAGGERVHRDPADALCEFDGHRRPPIVPTRGRPAARAPRPRYTCRGSWSVGRVVVDHHPDHARQRAGHRHLPSAQQRHAVQAERASRDRRELGVEVVGQREDAADHRLGRRARCAPSTRASARRWRRGSRRPRWPRRYWRPVARTAAWARKSAS